MEETSPTSTRGEEMHVELGEEGSATLSSQLVEIVNTLQLQLAQLRRSIERILKSSEEWKKLIRDQTEKSSHKSVEIEGMKNTNSDQLESGGDSERGGSESMATKQG